MTSKSRGSIIESRFRPVIMSRDIWTPKWTVGRCGDDALRGRICQSQRLTGNRIQHMDIFESCAVCSEARSGYVK